MDAECSGALSILGESIQTAMGFLVWTQSWTSIIPLIGHHRELGSRTTEDVEVERSWEAAPPLVMLASLLNLFRGFVGSLSSEWDGRYRGRAKKERLDL